MNYIVIDLEFNGRRHYDIYPMEIIEIGAVKLNEHLEIVETFRSYIRPKYPINRFALEFCGITKETLLDSRPFTDVIPEFIAFCGIDYKLFAWGSSDFFSLVVDCKVNRIPGDWIMNMVDMTRFFEGGLQQALEHYELQPVGQHHSALDDACNAVQLMRLKPEALQCDQYYRPDPYKLCTSGIRKWILMSLDASVKQGKVLTWNEFVQDKKTLSYIHIMNLTDSELAMIKSAFDRYYKQHYGRKNKHLLNASKRPAPGKEPNAKIDR